MTDRPGRLLRSLALAALLSSAATAAGASELAAMIEDFAACTGISAPVQVVVAGLPNGQSVLSKDEADRLRIGVEAKLQRTNRVHISAARDVRKLRALFEASGSVNTAGTRTLLSTAHSGDAAIFIIEPERRGETIAFRLQALSSDARCKVISKGLVVSLPPAGAESAERILEAGLRQLLQTAPDTEALAACPVVTEAGYSGCARAVRDRLIATATELAASSNRILSGRRLKVVRPGPAACAAEAPFADATVRSVVRLSQDSGGGMWLALEFRRGAEIVSAGKRTRVDLVPLGCDATVRPLLDHVRVTASRNPQRLDLTAPPFRAGDRLNVRVELGEQAALYCMIIAPDQTAYVMLPARASAEFPPGKYSYPGDFGLSDVVLSGHFENLFHCFAPSSPLPAGLETLWQKTGPALGTPKLLDATGIRTLLDRMRALPGMDEATARIIVRETK